MKVITHRYRESNKYKTSYLINLVDYNGSPLESHVARNSREKVVVSEYVNNLKKHTKLVKMKKSLVWLTS